MLDDWQFFGPDSERAVWYTGKPWGWKLRPSLDVRTMSRNAYIVTVVALCGLMMGCIPVPKKSVVRYGVEGRVADAASGQPIAKARISVAVDGREFSKKTNREGAFKVAPEMHHFWTWLGGPMWMDATRATVQISVAGYAPYDRTFIVRSEGLDAPVPDKDRLEGSYLLLDEIGMKKGEPGGAADGGQPSSSETRRGSEAAGLRRCGGSPRPR